MAKKKQAEPGLDPNAWMVTFSDLVTLLLTFFVMLLSMSTMNVERVQKIMTSFTGGSGVLEYTDMGAVSPYEEQLKALSKLNLNQLPDEEVLLDVFLGRKVEGATAVFDDPTREISLRKTQKGVSLIFGSRLLFDSGSAVLKKEAAAALELAAKIINQINRPISIEGHTDSQPLPGSGEFASNWELSLARALAVRNFLVDRAGVKALRMRVAAFADARPLEDNATAEGRLHNRRIEIVFQWIR